MERVNKNYCPGRWGWVKIIVLVDCILRIAILYFEKCNVRNTFESCTTVLRVSTVLRESTVLRVSTVLLECFRNTLFEIVFCWTILSSYQKRNMAICSAIAYCNITIWVLQSPEYFFENCTTVLRVSTVLFVLYFAELFCLYIKKGICHS